MQEIIEQLTETMNSLKQKKIEATTIKTTDYDAQILKYQKAIDALKKVM